MKKSVIAVVFGGCSSEYEISLQSAAAVLRHIDRTRYTPLQIGVTREGEWFVTTADIDDIERDMWFSDICCTPCIFDTNRQNASFVLSDESHTRLFADALFPIMHGKNAEDGTIQGMAQIAGLPLIGCGVLSSALCMDKLRAHQIASVYGINVPKAVGFSKCATEQTIARAAHKIGYPLFVKPVRAGSSFGITRVERPEHLAQAVRDAFAYDREILLEQAIDGFEVGCAVVGRDDALQTGLVDEIELSQGFFNYTEKYTLQTSRIHCPARITLEKTEEIIATAKMLYRAMDCKGFARVDLFLTPKGEIYFNEINTIPGFTAHSRFPNMMKGAGVSFERLVNDILAQGLAYGNGEN